MILVFVVDVNGHFTALEWYQIVRFYGQLELFSSVEHHRRFEKAKF